MIRMVISRVKNPRTTVADRISDRISDRVTVVQKQSCSQKHRLIFFISQIAAVRAIFLVYGTFIHAMETAHQLLPLVLSLAGECVLFDARRDRRMFSRSTLKCQVKRVFAYQIFIIILSFIRGFVNNFCRF